MEKTLIIFKPDTMHRGLVGKILSRFETKGLTILGLKLMQISQDLAHRHYADHQDKPFFAGLVEYMTSSPVVVAALGGNQVISVARKLMGATNGANADPGTIRGDFGCSMSFNLVHGSDSPEAAAREISLFFKPEELIAWTPEYLKVVLNQEEI